MKFAFVNFTYANDKGLVEQMVRGVARIKRLYPEHDITLSIYDDAATPLGDIFACDHYEQTTWNRNGNLNGLEAITGILTAYKEAAERTGADYVIKIDSDTYVCTLGWLADKDPEETFAVYSTFSFLVRPIGSCYAISKSAIDPLLALIEQEDIIKRIKKGYGPEDRCILALARMSGKWDRRVDRDRLYYGPIHEGAKIDPNLALVLEQEGLLELEEMYDNVIARVGITFKPHWSRVGHEEQIVTATEQMKAFADWAEDQPLPSAEGDDLSVVEEGLRDE